MSDLDYLVIRLAIGFILGGGWTNVTLFIMERRPTGDLGAFIGGLPSTAAFSFAFIAWVVSPATAVEATAVFPLSMGLTGVFLLLYALLSTRGFPVGFTGALAVWHYGPVRRGVGPMIKTVCKAPWEPSTWTALSNAKGPRAECVESVEQKTGLEKKLCDGVNHFFHVFVESMC